MAFAKAKICWENQCPIIHIQNHPPTLRYLHQIPIPYHTRADGPCSLDRPSMSSFTSSIHSFSLVPPCIRASRPLRCTNLVVECGDLELKHRLFCLRSREVWWRLSLSSPRPASGNVTCSLSSPWFLPSMDAQPSAMVSLVEVDLSRDCSTMLACSINWAEITLTNTQ